jgi:hypothetical protein
MKLRFALLIGIGAIFLAVYVIATFFSPVDLVVHIKCIKGGISISSNTLSSSCPNGDIHLNDSLLLQSPKLKEALLKAPTSEPAVVGGERYYIAHMSMAEFDQMNRMLISTSGGQELAKVTPSYYSATSALWPKSVWVVSVDYNGNLYDMTARYLGIPPFDTGWFV